MGREIIKQAMKEKGIRIKIQVPKIDNYLENVEEFHKEQQFFYDQNKLFWFWSFKETKYVLIDETDVLNTLEAQLELYGSTIKSNVKNNYLEAIKRVGRNKTPKEPPITWIQYKNKVIDFTTGKIIAATPKYFFTNPIPHTISESEETPTIDKMFSEWVGKENVKKLKQVVAFCIARKYFLHRIIFLVGNGINGKGSFLEFLRNFLGLQNITSTSLELLINNRFEAAKLYKKLAAIMGETNYQRIEKSDLLKRLSGGDLIGYEFKNKNPFDEENYAKLIIATNSLPLTLDKTKGFYRRMMIIFFPNEFNEKKDIIKTIPKIEYSNFAKQSITLLKDLWINREFDNEATIEERQQIYEDTSNPLQLFLREHTEKHSTEHIFKADFDKKFYTYQRENGYRVWNYKELGTRMKELFDDGQRGSEQQRVWLGLKWKTHDTQGIPIQQNILYREVKHPVDVVYPVYKEEFIDEKPKTWKEQITIYIKENDDKKGILTNDIILYFSKLTDISIPRVLDEMKREGLIFEVKPGRWKVI